MSKKLCFYHSRTGYKAGFARYTFTATYNDPRSVEETFSLGIYFNVLYKT